MNDIILFVGVVLLSASQISAYCFHSAPIASPPPGAGKVEPAVCTYNGEIYYEGESWDTDNCEECNCGASGAYGCCGYGFHAGPMSFGAGCTFYQFDCLNGVIVNDPDKIGYCEMDGEEIHLTRS